MASENINQIFTANPITSNLSTDLMYFGQSPYGIGNDAAMTFANFSSQFVSSSLTSAHFYVGNGSNIATNVAMSGDASLSNAGAVTVSSIGGKAISLANSFTTVGNFPVTQTYTGTTNLTYPTSGTVATTSQIPTGAALTSSNDTNVTLTLGGSPTTALINAASITAGWAGTLSLARGGLAANLTASNGGIFYSTASAGAILSGTATANQALLSGSNTTPAWSTATYPSTTTINQLLYSSAANTIGGLATANNSVLVTSNTGVPSLSTTLPSGISATNMNLTTPTLGVATATSLGFSPSTGGINGTTAADNASSGTVGEFISSTVLVGSAVSVSNNTTTNITSINLTAGDWDVFGNVLFNPAAGTIPTNLIGAVSTTSASLPTAPNGGYVQLQVPFATGASFNGFAIGTSRVNVSTTTTVFLVALASFSVSTMTAIGFIGARRRR